MIYTISGPNSFLRRIKLDQITTTFTEKFGDLALEQFDAEEAEPKKIIEALQSLPFLSPKKLIIVYNIDKQKSLLESIEHIISSIPETNDVVFESMKLDKRGNAYKVLKTQTELIDCQELSLNELPKWLCSFAKEQGATLDMATAHYLIEKAGTNQQLLVHEIEKLITHNPRITKDSIDLLTQPLPQSSVFQLLDTAFAGNGIRAMQLYQEQRAQRVEPLAILAMISWQLHILSLIKAADNMPIADIAAQAKLSPFVVQKAHKLAKKRSMTHIKTLVHRAHRLDIQLKSQPIDADDALRQFLLAHVAQA